MTTEKKNKLSRIEHTLTMAATLLCGLALSVVSNDCLAQSQVTYDAAVQAHQGWVQIPGELIRPDCVHEIPNGAKVEIENGRITGDVMLNGALYAHYDACTEEAVVTRHLDHAQSAQGGAHNPGTGNGWVEADQWNAPLSSSDDIDYLGGTWKVPTYPTMDGALIYMFNGIVPADGSWILQPVLQFGAGPAGGGNYWAIASWLVSSSQAFHSPLESVNPGNTISGYTEMTSISGSTKYWEVMAQDTTTGAYSWISAHVSGEQWTWAFRGVLEAYNVSSCSQFPSSGKVIFSNSQVAHGFPYYDLVSPNWVGSIYGYGGPSCHFAVVAASGTLDY